MLTLSRKVGERIKIGDNITLVVCRLNNKQVRLAIEAPQEVRILRAELEDRDPPSDTPLPAPVAA